MELAREELGLHSRATLGIIPVQGTRDRCREGSRDGSASTEINAARSLSPCLAVRSGSTNAAWVQEQDTLFFLLQSGSTGMG